MGPQIGTRGYTMVELVAVLVLTGIILTFAMARLGPMLEHAKVHSAANVVAGDLQYAQALAVRHRKPVAVIVAPATLQYLIRDRDDPTVVYRTRVFDQSTEFDLDQLNAFPPSTELFPNGVARATTILRVGLRGYTRDIKLTRAGQIRIIRP